MAELETLLKNGIDAARRGDRATGRRLLTQVLEEQPRNEKAWLWLASCMTKREDRRKCLNRVLEINPGNERAKQALALLDDSAPAAASGIDAEAIERLREKPSPRSAPPRPIEVQGTEGDGLRLFILGTLALVLIGGVIFLIVQVLNLTGDDDPEPPAVVAEPTATEAPVIAPTFTLPPPPTATFLPIEDDRLPTLPPTFTPTPTTPPTQPPAPTATPPSQDEFLILFTALDDGADEPALYAMRGDGSGLQQLEADIRDVAFDPSGREIAFVRDVANADGESFPQIFVAPFDDIGAARQVTDLPASINGQPSWSPEARELAFVSDHDGVEDIWTVNLDTGVTYNVTQGETPSRQPAWRPVLGSRTVIYTAEISVGFELFAVDIRDEGVEVEPRRLTVRPNNYAPSWNANGQRVTFLSDRGSGDDADVYTMDADGGDQRLVTRDDGGAEDRSPQFSPDGRYIAFISNRLGERFDVYLISPDGNVLNRLTERDADAIQLVYQPVLFYRLSD